jgi:hypothetical protein
MNELCDIAPLQVTEVRDLLDEWDNAQDAISDRNIAQDGRALVKADVLEWKVIDAGLSSPQAEVSRIRGLLYLYFGFCPMFAEQGSMGLTALVRS